MPRSRRAEQGCEQRGPFHMGSELCRWSGRSWHLQHGWGPSFPEPLCPSSVTATCCLSTNTPKLSKALDRNLALNLFPASSLQPMPHVRCLHVTNASTASTQNILMCGTAAAPHALRGAWRLGRPWSWPPPESKARSATRGVVLRRWKVGLAQCACEKHTHRNRA